MTVVRFEILNHHLLYGRKSIKIFCQEQYFSILRSESSASEMPNIILDCQSTEFQLHFWIIIHVVFSTFTDFNANRFIIRKGLMCYRVGICFVSSLLVNWTYFEMLNFLALRKANPSM